MRVGVIVCGRKLSLNAWPYRASAARNFANRCVYVGDENGACQVILVTIRYVALLGTQALRVSVAPNFVTSA